MPIEPTLEHRVELGIALRLGNQVRESIAIHLEGHWDPDGTAMITAIGRVLGRPLRVKRLPWGLLRLVAPFNETVRELLEMKPLWQQPVRLDNRKLVALLGEERRTPLDEAVHATLRGIGAT